MPNLEYGATRGRNATFPLLFLLMLLFVFLFLLMFVFRVNSRYPCPTYCGYWIRRKGTPLYGEKSTAGKNN